MCQQRPRVLGYSDALQVQVRMPDGDGALTVYSVPASLALGTVQTMERMIQSVCMEKVPFSVPRPAEVPAPAGLLLD
jgi:hypothetical protein